jgi:hypothetical protein
VTVINPAEIEQININGSPESVYIGPCNGPNPSFADYVMCFNAAASASATTAVWAINTAGAVVLTIWCRESEHDRVDRIAVGWLRPTR